MGPGQHGVMLKEDRCGGSRSCVSDNDSLTAGASTGFSGFTLVASFSPNRIKHEGNCGESPLYVEYTALCLVDVSVHAAKNGMLSRDFSMRPAF